MRSLVKSWCAWLLLLGVGFAASASPALAGERKALDVVKDYHTGLTGFSDDDVYRVDGHIVRVELTFEKEGPISGGANEVLPRKDGEVRIHRYLDLFSHLPYHLIVYVE